MQDERIERILEAMALAAELANRLPDHEANIPGIRMLLGTMSDKDLEDAANVVLQIGIDMMNDVLEIHQDRDRKILKAVEQADTEQEKSKSISELEKILTTP